MKLSVIDKTNHSIKSIQLEDAQPSENLAHIFYLVHHYQKHQLRQKTASTKTRAEVRGGGAKPYKQKGTGRARRGTNRTPLRVGGGVIFGPKPIKRKMKLNKLLVRKALQQALLLAGDKITLLKSDGFDFASAKEILKKQPAKKVLIILNFENQDLQKSFGNFKNCVLSTPQRLLLQTIIVSDSILIEESALSELGFIPITGSKKRTKTQDEVETL